MNWFRETSTAFAGGVIALILAKYLSGATGTDTMTAVCVIGMIIALFAAYLRKAKSQANG